jgi:DNA-binding MarR family transcriptional regulator
MAQTITIGGYKMKNKTNNITKKEENKSCFGDYKNCKGTRTFCRYAKSCEYYQKTQCLFPATSHCFDPHMLDTLEAKPFYPDTHNDKTKQMLEVIAETIFKVDNESSFKEMIEEIKTLKKLSSEQKIYLEVLKHCKGSVRKAFIAYRRFTGFTYEEIGQELGITRQAIHRHVDTLKGQGLFYEVIKAKISG